MSYLAMSIESSIYYTCVQYIVSTCTKIFTNQSHIFVRILIFGTNKTIITRFKVL